MMEKVLFVDDDLNVLDGYRRQLRKSFQVETADDGKKGLEILGEKGPFPVIVADLRMPGMDGIQVLAEVKERFPDTVRIMLTGNADMETAIQAVNEGNIFRFLTKPCRDETLVKVLTAGIEQYRLVTAERELLERTLRGSVRVLTDMLGLLNPSAFSRSARIRQYVRHMAVALQFTDVWRYELAAMLSQIGCVTVPSEILDRFYAQRSLTKDEMAMYASHTSVGCKLLANIPRLESVAHMIEGQLKPFADYPAERDMSEEEHAIAVGAQMLSVAVSLDQLLLSGQSLGASVANMQMRKGKYNPGIVDTLKTLKVPESKGDTVKTVTVNDLRLEMVADEDIVSKNDVLLVSKGQAITYPVLARLRNFARQTGVQEPFRVRLQGNTVQQMGQQAR